MLPAGEAQGKITPTTEASIGQKGRVDPGLGTGEDHSNDPLTLQSHDQFDHTLRRVSATVLVTVLREVVWPSKFRDRELWW